MRRRLPLLLAVLALVLAAAPSDAAQRRVPRGWLGVVADGPVTAGDAAEWTRMASAGVETVRVAFPWTLLQPVGTPAAAGPRDAAGIPLDFRVTDALVAAAARHGMTVLPVIQQPPPWAALAPGLYGSPPASAGAVGRLFRALVRRYGPRGGFWAVHHEVNRAPIRAWQVFNEPNLPFFWSTQPFAPSYVGALRAASKAIHASDPGATVVLGGLPNQSWIALEQIYRASGRGSFDAVALHPYTAQASDVMRLVRYSRAVMRRHGDGRMPIWLTEVSWPASRAALGPLGDFATTDAGQAARLADLFPRLLNARTALRIERVIWYTWLSTEGPTDHFGYSGLRRVEAGGRRASAPAMRVFLRWARKLEGCRKARGNARRCA